jgi:structural maintenance of chromosome 2
MHIKEITIDGFKSYSVKTHLGYLDNQFNSITGLNGSGKSNILDAICFVLGISSLSHVRASNLNELIYKYGQAGVNKAVVSIHFDNTDKSCSPLNYMDYNEIIVTRIIQNSKSKYLLNGYNVTQENIKSFFYSVNININNPHFLIMQGKVTQVVNMKPLEILGLLEEAAGTSMYENNKEKAIKAMKKKENKVEEINKTILDEISPHLEKLLKDKQNYLTWKSRENEINNLQKLLSAKNYQIKMEQISDKNSEIASIKENCQRIKTEYDLKSDNLNNFYKEMNKIEKLISKEDDEELKDLLNKNKNINNELKNIKQKEEILIKNNKKSELEINKYENDLAKIKINHENLQKEKIDKENSLKMLEKEMEMKEGLLKEYERNLDNIKKGISNQDNEIYNIKKIISEIKNNLTKCNLEKNNLTSQLKFFEEEINSVNKKMKDFRKNIDLMKNKSKDLDNQIDALRNEMNFIEKGESNNDNINYININPAQIVEELRKEINQEEEELQKYQEKQNELLNKYSARVEVIYRDPEQNFDRRKVKGRIIRLFTVDNDIYVTALEQLAGARLYNIVTDNEMTSGLLLNRKCFDRLETFIPLNKIIAREIPEDIKKLVKDVAGDEATLAIDLIKFDKELTPAMRYVFGTTYVCKNSEIAKKLTFNDRIRVRCVNLSGDVFDPQGSLTGGSTIRNSDNIILKVKEINYIQGKIKESKGNLMDKKTGLQNKMENVGRCANLKLNLDKLIQEKNSFNEENITKQIKTYENQLIKLDEDVKRTKERIKTMGENEIKLKEELKNLSSEQEDFKVNGSSKDVYLKKIKDCKINLTEIDKNLKEIKRNINDVQFDLKKKDQEIKDYEEK